MNVSIQTLPEKKLIGLRLPMSFVHNRTGELWGSFMPRRKEITNVVGTDLFSVNIYTPDFFKTFNPQFEFEKWAAVEVNDFNHLPGAMETLVIPTGLYAVFLYKGSSSEGDKIFRYIFTEWLPSSGYELDNRPHFELLGEKYKNNAPDSEEEIWIPIKIRN